MDDRAWEDEIDVDDSDLPSLLPLLSPCSTSQRPRSPSPPPPQKRQHLIPGPAGPVQVAMHRQSAALASRPSSDGGGGVAAILDVEDMDFKLNPWLCALDFLGERRFSARHSPINTIKTSRTAHRVEQVVGIVSSSRPNGLGSLFITLKDPTGTIGAFIHHKVLMDRGFGSGELAVGCVLILKKVVVFPVRAASYLNVTLNNMAKLINKDCGPPQRSAITTSIASGKEIGSGIVPADGMTCRPLAENFANVGSFREHVTVGLVEEVPSKAALTFAMSQEVSKDKRTGVNTNQRPNESLPCTSSSSDVTICTQMEEARRTHLLAEAEQNPHDQVARGANWMDSNAKRKPEPAGRPQSGTRVSSVSTCDMMAEMAASQRRCGIEKVHADEDMGTTSSRPENGTSVKGPSGSLTSSMAGVPATSCVMLEPSAKDKEPETLISKASVTEWTDEQIKELFSDYQEADEMDMFLL